MTFTLKQLSESVSDPKEEGRLYDEMLGLRERFPGTMLSVKSGNRDEEIRRAHTALTLILDRILAIRDVTSGEPGHGPGHWCRDYIHALRLAHDPELEPRHILPCILGGTLHDIGTLFLDRYADKGRAFRHAEAAALIVRAAALESGALNPDEVDLVAYTVAAHTHYLKASEVECADGVKRAIAPYVDTDGAGPLLAVWMPRWADRLDCSGPCFPGRHYLTLDRDHEDYGQGGFYKVSFAEHMAPTLRTSEEIKAAGGRQTMLEHMRMFAASQSDNSPYGVHDRGLMVKLRDIYRESLEHIIYQVAHPSDVNEERIAKLWTRFLGKNVEPSRLGTETAEKLDKAFTRLDPDTRRAWSCGFRACTTEYLAWSDRILTFLATLPVEFRLLPGIGDIRSVIVPVDMYWL